MDMNKFNKVYVSWKFVCITVKVVVDDLVNQF